MFFLNGMEKLEIRLKQNLLFKDIPGEKLSEIARQAEDEIVPAHQIIFQEGDSGDRFYLINSGEVRLFKKNRNRLEIPLVELGSGEFFGQVAILTDDVRCINAETKKQTHLTTFSRRQFENILDNYPNGAPAFIKQMSRCMSRQDTATQKASESVETGPKASWLDFIALFVLSLMGGILFNYANPNGINLIPSLLGPDVITSVAPSRAIAHQVSKDTLFVDARPSVFYEKEHIKGSINIPLALFDIMYMMELSEVDKKRNIIVYGRTISSHYDEQLARKLVLRGHDNTTLLKGGLTVWKKKGYPIKP